MRTLLLPVLVLCFASAAGQNAFRQNDVYVELLGNGIGASIGYERQLQARPGLGIRVGVGYYSGNEQFRFSIPIGLNYLFNLNNNRSFIETGIGATWSGADGLKTAKQEAAAGGRDHSERIWSLVPSIGYRRHTKGNIMWRASFTPIINKYRTMPWAGIAAGIRL